MCGILAYFSHTALATDHTALTSVTHRGPDGEGLETFTIGDHCLSLGHRRLSIIDLSDSGLQPMQLEGRQYWITYNGEIYNYLELKDELQKKGVQFHTTSDTEVLLAAFAEWGPECLTKFNGMFAFVIWDAERQTLFAARDRFGIKPLYLWNTSHGLALVSEIKQLIDLPGFERRLNANAAAQFLNYADFGVDTQTMWQDVREFEPGTMLSLPLARWRLGKPAMPQRWYKLPDAAPHRMTPEIAEDTLRQLLENAIRLRLRADVPVGTALSGGLDSSAITCLIAKSIQPDVPFHTFSACYQESEGDETPYIRQVLNEIQANAHEVTISSDVVSDQMAQITWLHDLPIVGRAVFPYYHLCDFIHQEGLKVVLQGQGADEILGGYGEFHRAYFCELLAGLRLVRLSSEYWHYRKYNPANLRSDIKRVLGLTFPSIFGQTASAVPGYLKVETHAAEHRELERQQATVAQVHEVRFTAIRMLLHNVDRASMAHSVEVRLPFLDHHLVEFCLSLPAEYKMANGLRKVLLRNAMRGLLPEAIRTRTDKMGFSSPEATWAKGPLLPFYREQLAQLDSALIHADKAREAFESFVAGNRPFDRSFWRLISFQNWLTQFKIAA